MKINIIGAGMAGLLAANMLRRHEVEVSERNTTLPKNHTALLRFRSGAVSDATGIPFEKVTVRKGLWDGERVINTPTIAHLNRYSAMVTDNELHDRSILNLESAVRWVAPRDFIELMARNVRLEFGKTVDRPRMDHPVISTMPMPAMMKIVGWKDIPAFQFKPVWTIKAKITAPKSHICQTLYNTEEMEWYRATIHGDDLTLEFMHQPCWEDEPNNAEIIAAHAVFRFFNEHKPTDYTERLGIKVENVSINKMAIGKIMPINDTLRKEFMAYLTEKWNIFSLGRFATWRNILLDDVVQDVKRIEAMMHGAGAYDRRLMVS
jgi:hypothetical protein